MKRILSLLLLSPLALNATPYPKGMILRASLMLQGECQHITQVRMQDNGDSWQTRVDDVSYSSDLYAIALAIKKVTQEKSSMYVNDPNTYPCLHIETTITKKNDPTQKDVKNTPITFGFFDASQHIYLDLKDDAGKPIKLILCPQFFTVRDQK